MSDLYQEIKEIKEELGDHIVIPAHHYQKDEIVAFADFLGDSYKLAVDCSKTDSKYILFCGVHFMAEGAAVLAGEEQLVVTPDLDAGCPMADMVTAQAAEKASTAIVNRGCPTPVPIVYMNSSAAVKAFCGAGNGTVCTSSNAAKIVSHYLDAGQSVLFFPDYNLGVNTAKQLGLTARDIATVNRDGTLGLGDFQGAKMFLWDGYCHVHKRFGTADITDLRKRFADIRIIVHPECKSDVVDNADYAGSTSMIYNTVKQAEPGTVWGIGTEHNFVARIAAQCPDKTVMPLQKSYCTDMNLITLEKMATTIRAIAAHFKGEGPLHNPVTVPEVHKRDARKALQQMIAIVEGTR